MLMYKHNSNGLGRYTVNKPLHETDLGRGLLSPGMPTEIRLIVLLTGSAMTSKPMMMSLSMCRLMWAIASTQSIRESPNLNGGICGSPKWSRNVTSGPIDSFSRDSEKIKYRVVSFLRTFL